MAEKERSKTIKIKYVRSVIGACKDHKVILRSLGLRRLNQVVERADTPFIRGVIKKIPHIVQVVD
jgi:large subunit ribosomal protein L30